MKKQSRFEILIDLLNKNKTLLRCPICHLPLQTDGGSSLVCENKHSFNIAKKGYVNLLTGKKTSELYDISLFEMRREVFESGYYDEFVLALYDVINQTAVFADSYANNINGNMDISSPVILDSGCGEGFFSAKLTDLFAQSHAQPSPFFAATDISKEAISFATRHEREIMWLVSDLAHLPLQDNSVDMILDILAPANYAEFKRVLSPGSLLIKCIPGTDYLKELRTIKDTSNFHADSPASQSHTAGPDRNSKSNDSKYDNSETLSYTESKLSNSKKTSIHYTKKVMPQHKKALLGMSPVMSGKTFNPDLVPLDEITIHLEILVGFVK